jgi:methyl coenzyme M reductase subunit D
LPAHRIAAAALTVAFQIRKEGHLARHETVTDDMIKDEIKRLYYDFIGVTDPNIGVQAAAQAARRKP